MKAMRRTAAHRGSEVVDALGGMAAHLTLPVSHSFMMNSPEGIAQTLTFLANGAFAPDLTWHAALESRLRR